MLDLRDRLKWFLRYQRRSWLRLLRPVQQVRIDLSSPFCTPHPSDACRCDDPTTAHLPECEWGKIACRTCRGMGYCPDCGGSCEDPTRGVTDPDRDLVPSAESPGLHDQHCIFVPPRLIGVVSLDHCATCGERQTKHCEICAVAFADGAS